MRVLITIVFLMIFSGLVPVSLALAQELDLLREDVRTAAHAEGARGKRRRDCDDYENPMERFLGWALLQTIAAPYRLPRVMVEDVDFSPGHFVDSPYVEFEDVVTGQLVSYDGFVTHGLAGDETDSAWMLRTRVDYVDDLDALSKIGGQFLFDSSIRFGIESEFNHYREDFRQGVDDELWIGDVNMVYRFAQSDRLQMRSGIGANWLSDRDATDWGFNFTYGGDWFPRRPWVVSTELDLGTLGEASLFHGRVTGGVLWRNTEVYLGYEHLSVGGADIDGLITGLRFWF